jgi:exopolysaccharide biosynthesis predicted pyruvyltransferase EpsI
MKTAPEAEASIGGARVAERGAALAGEGIRVVREALAGHVGRPWALLDFPCFPNVGDNAIWLGTRAALTAIGMPPPTYTCDNRTFEPDVLARLVGDGPILLLGGGNFGDLFAKHQRLREQVVARFPSNPVVQLPQTIRFRGSDALEATRRALAPHRDLKVLVRDAKSLEVATRDLRLDAALCPDLAFGLGPAGARPHPPRRIFWLSRYDSWRLHVPPPPGEDLVVADWPKERLSFRRAYLRFLSSRIRRGRARGTRERTALSALYDPLARWRVARGLDRLAEGSVVITDRLHGHVLSMRSGTPHVLLDDRTGKVRAFHETWTRGVDGVAWANDRAEALALARQMLARQSPSDAPRA